jgi:DNA-directed RNA polymerase specialized sigma24 family protein
MKTSCNNQNNDGRWLENTSLISVDFDFGALDDSPLFDGEFGECLKDGVNNYLFRKLLQMLIVFDEFTDEERKALIGREVERKKFREIGREINRDHKTVQARYNNAIAKIQKSPLVNVDFKRKRKERR